ncbi:helix-turn-helix domain-containing protein [Amycolatopsis sp. NPDC050768]|uniref:TetR/AcrR family transcriptional regulator n=1 Tax=Amycolatopsis sp. NPDC050768 TaxID=3154839 RepID=UPI0033D90CBA
MRADARRNYERLLATAVEVVAEQGADASLEEIARRAGVGSATLHRHFPGRAALLEAVFRERVENLCTLAAELATAPSPGDALVTWLRAVVAHASAARGLGAALLLGAKEGREYHAKILDAGHRLLARAQQAGEANEATGTDDLLLLVNAISLATEDDADRADALLTLVVAGVRRPKPVR